MRFKTILLLALVALLALPLAAQDRRSGVNVRANGNVDFTIGNVPPVHAIGWCLRQSGYDANGGLGWGDPSKTCADTMGGASYVDLGVCTEQQATDAAALPTVTCTQARVDQGVCPTEALGSLIPKPLDCAKAYLKWQREWGKTSSLVGWAGFVASNAPADPAIGSDFGDDVSP